MRDKYHPRIDEDHLIFAQDPQLFFRSPRVFLKMVHLKSFSS